jgi:hypothetical protein
VTAGRQEPGSKGAGHRLARAIELAKKDGISHLNGAMGWTALA